MFAIPARGGSRPLPELTRSRVRMGHGPRRRGSALHPSVRLPGQMDASRMSVDLHPESSPDVHEPLEELVALAYHELRAIAHGRLSGGGRGGTLSTTALVHEAYLKLVDQSRGIWRSHAHFLAVASLAMRHVLVDCAKARGTLKRGGDRQRITLDDAMKRLGALEPRLARVVECRFFGGMSEEEIADALGLTVRTVRRDWVKARVLLQRMLDC